MAVLRKSFGLCNPLYSLLDWILLLPAVPCRRKNDDDEEEK